MAENDITNEAQAEQKLTKNKISKEQIQKQQRTLLIILVVAVVGIVFILFRNGIIGGSGGEAPVEKYLTAIADRDFESYVESMPPRIAEGYRSDLTEMGMTGEEYMTELYSDYIDEFGDDMTVDVTFNGRSALKAIYVDSFKDSYLEMYGETIGISSAFELDVTAHFSGSKSDDYIELDCFVIKSGGKWYIAGCEYETEEIEAPEVSG